MRGVVRRLVIPATALLLLSCSTGPSGPSVRNGGTLYVALDANPASLIPLLANDIVSRRAYTPLYPLLYTANTDLSIGPDLAAALPAVSDGGKTWKVTLRSDAKWSDGMPVSADDVVFTVSSERDPALRVHAASPWSGVQKVEKVDKSTVKFTLAAPDATFLAGSLVTPIVPQHAFADQKPAQIAAHPDAKPAITGGPYLFNHRDDNAIFLDANPQYFLGRPHMDHVVETIVKEPGKVLDQLESGKLSWVPVLDAVSAAAGASSPGVTVDAYPSLALDAMVFNVRGGHVFADSLLRQALASSIGHDDLVTQATSEAQGYPVWGDVNPGSWAYTQSAATHYSLDVNHAKDLLGRAGWQAQGTGTSWTKGGQPLAADVIYPKSDATLSAAVTLITTQAKSSGIELRPRELDDAAFSSALTHGSFDAAMVSLPTGLDPDDGAFLATGGPENYGGYSNPALDALIAGERNAVPAGNQTVQQVRKPIFQHIEQTVSSELPLLFLWVPRAFTGFNATVNGVAGAGAQLDADRADTFYRDWFL